MKLPSPPLWFLGLLALFQLARVCCQLFFPPTTTIFPDHPVPLFDDRGCPELGYSVVKDSRFPPSYISGARAGQWLTS